MGDTEPDNAAEEIADALGAGGDRAQAVRLARRDRPVRGYTDGALPLFEVSGLTSLMDDGFISLGDQSAEQLPGPSPASSQGG
jgi:hypothetical protein